jgi:L,D-peptidoglycan transpeptidase YkuD (ErfK/YbiS/YcfS/YnhG family)
LRQVLVNFKGFDGAVHRGALVVRADVAPSTARIFTRLFEIKFPIHRMSPIEAYHGDDNASMAADNTSAFNCRSSSQSNAPIRSSPHANGRAIDVNPYENPWIDPRCHCFRPDAKFGDHSMKSRSGPGVITKGSGAWRIFIAEGWIWQDNATLDYQHFDTGFPSRPLRAAATPFSVPVTVGNANQIITVKTSGTRATVTAWARVANRWHVVMSTTSGRIGSGGITKGTTRRQNTNTTPSGTYSLTQAFGILSNPGTTLPYHVVTNDDWWVEDNNSPYYNTMRSDSMGGFDTSAPESSVNGSEHLGNHANLYRYVIVVNFNMHPSTPYRGAGIFLHVSNGHPTAGCIAVPLTTIVALLRWLNPAALPRIAIG